MSLAQLATGDDIKRFVAYLARKPAGATAEEATRSLQSVADRRRLAAYETFGIVVREHGKYKLTDRVGRALSRASDEQFAELLRQIVASIPPYFSCLEWAFEGGHQTLSSSDVGAFWHDHFRTELGTDNEKEITLRAVCFLQLASAGGIGTFVMGRRGQPTRIEFDDEVLRAFVATAEFSPQREVEESEKKEEFEVASVDHPPNPSNNGNNGSAGEQKRTLGGAIFVGHGKNKEPLKQLQNILTQFKVPNRVVIDEPNLGRPVGKKVRETLEACNCAILIFTCDEELVTPDGKTIWRPSENVFHELGAASYLYDTRIVILKEEGVVMPSNVSELCHISFSKGQLEAKGMEILKELIGFGIVKVST